MDTLKFIAEKNVMPRMHCEKTCTWFGAFARRVSETTTTPGCLPATFCSVRKALQRPDGMVANWLYGVAHQTD